MRNILTIAVGLLLWNGSLAVAQRYIISTIAGNGTGGFSGDSGPAATAQLNNPTGVAVDGGGSLYIADYWNHRVRKISPNGVITTVAGTGMPGYSGDGGLAVRAQVWGPLAVAVDLVGNILIADESNHRIRKVAPDGIITTIAGTGSPGGYSGDGGPATSARLNGPKGVTVDTHGNLYIADTVNNRVRKVSPDGIITTVTAVNRPFGVAVDAAGSLYVADPSLYNNCVRKVSPDGSVATFAGTGWGGYSSNTGLAITVPLDQPTGVAVDAASLYIAGATSIRKVSRNGIIGTIAGSGTLGYSGDGGPATNARLSWPFGVAVSANGSIYVADSKNHAIRLLRPDFSSAPFISAVANAASNLSGSIAPGEIVVLYGSGIGHAQLARAGVNGAGFVVTQLGSVSVLFNGVPAPLLYSSATQVAAIVPYEVTGERARVVVLYQDQTSAPIAVPVASSAPALFTVDSSGTGQAAALNQDGSINGPGRPAIPGSIIVLFATGEGQTSPPGVNGKLASSTPPRPVLPVTVTIGGQSAPVWYAGGAPGQVAGLMQINAQIPGGVQPGNVPVVVQVGGNSSRAGVTIAVAEASDVLARQYVISSIAGNGTAGFSGDGGPATSARLNRPAGIALDVTGNLYIADYANNRVRKVAPDGIVTTVAGNGNGGYFGDGGPATSAELNLPVGVAVDAASNLYIADQYNNYVRAVSSLGIIAAFAGNGSYGSSGDGGPAMSAQLHHPTGVAGDAIGNLYIADKLNNRIRKVAPDGSIATIAGDGPSGQSGDNGPAVDGRLHSPQGVASDGDGNLYIADTLNNRIRKISPGGTITTVAGTGTAGYFGDGGQATNAQLAAPCGVAIDAAGNLYIADSSNNRIRLVSRTGIIATIAGTGAKGYSGDGGPATRAPLNNPWGIAVDAAGNIYLADLLNSAIRLLRPTR